MNTRTLLVAGVLASAAFALATAGLAQSTRTGGAASPALPPISHGPPIAGFCVFSPREIIATSKVGQSVDARLKVLGG